MIPTVSAPYIQAPPPVQTSVFHTAQALPSLGRLPPEVVGGLVSSSETNPQGKGATLLPVGTVPPQPSAESPVPFNAFLQALMPAASYGAQAPFLAQILGQSSGNESTQLAAFFSGEAPLPVVADYSALEQIKYKPSDAGLPPPPPAAFRYVEPPPPPDTAPVYVTAALSRELQQETPHESAPAQLPAVEGDTQVAAPPQAPPAEARAPVEETPLPPPAIPSPNALPTAPPRVFVPVVSQASTRGFRIYSENSARSAPNVSAAETPPPHAESPTPPTATP